MRPASYVRAFLATVVFATLAVAGVNLAAERWIAQSPQAGSLQLFADFGRIIKPVWLARSDAEIVVIGNSRVRDGFDPVLIRRDLGLRVFNYGLSGATAYETLRYAQDALARPGVSTVVIGATSFAAGSEGQPTGFGFEEARLAVTAQGGPTRDRDLWMAATRYLSGGGLGAHIQAIYALARLGGAGADTRPDLFPAYRPMTAETLEEGRRHHAGRSVRLTPWHRRQMERTLDLFCGGRVRALLFFEPDHAAVTAAWAANDAAGLADFKAEIVAGAARRNRSCGARIQVFDFMTPNPVTTEAVTPGLPSRYYREAVHFRPATGLLVLRRILGLPGALAGFGEEVTGGLEDRATLRQDGAGQRVGGAGRAGEIPPHS